MAESPSAKTHHLALLLPLSGLFLLMPPAILAFNLPVALFGVPMIVVYLFAVWALLIIGAVVLARRLAAPRDVDMGPPPDDQQAADPARPD